MARDPTMIRQADGSTITRPIRGCKADAGSRPGHHVRASRQPGSMDVPHDGARERLGFRIVRLDRHVGADPVSVADAWRAWPTGNNRVSPADEAGSRPGWIGRAEAKGQGLDDHLGSSSIRYGRRGFHPSR